jgi:hypothetical protein
VLPEFVLQCQAQLTDLNSLSLTHGCYYRATAWRIGVPFWVKFNNFRASLVARLVSSTSIMLHWVIPHADLGTLHEAWTHEESGLYV